LLGLKERHWRQRDAIPDDRQGLCAEGEEHGKKQPALRREGCFFPCRPTDGATVSVRKSASEKSYFSSAWEYVKLPFSLRVPKN
jgi:hypothetical protein